MIFVKLSDIREAAERFGGKVRANEDGGYVVKAPEGKVWAATREAQYELHLNAEDIQEELLRCLDALEEGVSTCS